MKKFKQNCDIQHKHYRHHDVKEVVKVAEISDKYENLRYKVILNDVKHIVDNTLKTCYQVQVVNYFSTYEPLIIVTKPELGESLIFDYDYALKIYCDYIKSYTALVRAETRDLQDISNYAEKLEYHLTCPQCCITCKWAKKPCSEYKHVIGALNKLECHNPKNI